MKGKGKEVSASSFDLGKEKGNSISISLMPSRKKKGKEQEGGPLLPVYYANGAGRKRGGERTWLLIPLSCSAVQRKRGKKEYLFLPFVFVSPGKGRRGGKRGEGIPHHSPWQKYF